MHFNSPSAILRTLYNSNAEKLPIVNRSQNLICAARSIVAGFPEDFFAKQVFLTFWGLPGKWTSGNKNLNLSPLYKRYFCQNKCKVNAQASWLAS